MHASHKYFDMALEWGQVRSDGVSLVHWVPELVVAAKHDDRALCNTQ